jgi:hypothetical protein
MVAATDQQSTSPNVRGARKREGAMPDSDDRPDVGQLWRTWLTETERQWNTFFNDVMSTDSFGRFMGGYMDIYSTFQRLVAQNMERSLSTLNVPSRSDIVELGERLSGVEERLGAIESSINTLAEAVGHPSEPAAVTQLRPRRTRRPRVQPAEAQ